MSLAHFGRRLLISLLALAGLMTSIFFLVRLTGDPVDLYLPVNASAATRAEMRARLGVDRPVLSQFFDWVGQMLHLDFGTSFWRSRPALDVALEALPNTLALGAIALIVAFAGAALLGSLAALNEGKPFDRVVRVLAQAAASVPDFWLGIMFILVFAVNLRLLPTSGFGGPAYWILPIVTLIFRPLGTLVQIIRGSMVDALNGPYVRTAKAKGAQQRRVTFVHTLRNALLPAITVTGDLAAQFAGGAGVVEVLFGFPGVGKVLLDGILKRDFALVQASIFCVAVVIFAINIAVEMLYSAVDPRVRSEN